MEKYRALTWSLDIVGGLDDQALDCQEFDRMANGKAMQYCYFDVKKVFFLPEENGQEGYAVKRCNVQYINAHEVSPERREWKQEHYLEHFGQNSLFGELLHNNLTDGMMDGYYHSKTAPEDAFWHLSGHIGFLQHDDGRMHELFFARYNATTQQGSITIFFDKAGRAKLGRHFAKNSHRIRDNNDKENRFVAMSRADFARIAYSRDKLIQCMHLW